MSDERVLVVTGPRGGRDDADAQLLWFCGTFFWPTRVVLGDADGVDKQARLFFQRMATVEVEVHRAIWRKNNIYNHYAGHDRNQKMIDSAPVEAHLLALPLWRLAGHRQGFPPEDAPDWDKCPGTDDCYKRGRAKGLTCHLR